MHNLSISVKDEGRGISKENLLKVFDRFYRVDRESPGTKASSHGVGLSIVKRMVDKMKGSVDVKSEEGVGSTFTITFPVSESDTSENDKLERWDSFDETLKGLKILLAEDNIVFASMLKKMLAKEGAEVFHVDDGSRVIEEYDRFNPDIVLLDNGLPNVTGRDVVVSMNEDPEKYSGARVVVISGGYIDIEGINRLRVERCQKPFTLAELKVKIAALTKPPD
jgi:CheY-like chemotaxis protein